MLPVTAGAKATRRQILIYSVLLAPLGMTPALLGLGGTFYAIVSGLGGFVFLVLALRVARSLAGEGPPEARRSVDRPARQLFGFSIFYLFALFAALLLERVIP
jgi:protoheme IX farnesyltransferase